MSDLDSNGIGDAGLAALALYLRRLPSLQELSLKMNPFGDQGIRDLVAPLDQTGGLPALKWLSLNQTRITTNGCWLILLPAIRSGKMPSLLQISMKPLFDHLATHAAVSAVERVSSRVMRKNTIRRWERQLLETLPVVGACVWAGLPGGAKEPDVWCCLLMLLVVIFLKSDCCSLSFLVY